MYPLADGMFAPNNQWYVAAWPGEVTRQPIERWLLDEPVAFYRKENEEVVALDGRCPHRSFPLGKSPVVDDDIERGFHGIRYRPDGSCSAVPSQSHVPSVCPVKSYAVVERWKWIWPTGHNWEFAVIGKNLTEEATASFRNQLSGSSGTV